MRKRVVVGFAWLGLFAATLVYTAWISHNPSVVSGVSLVHGLVVLWSFDKSPHVSRESLQRICGLLIGTLAPYLSIYSRSFSEMIVLSLITVGSIFLYGRPATSPFFGRDDGA
jgi:hypothetical protein